MTQTIQLDVVPPFSHQPALAILAAHAIPGLEESDRVAGTHRRLLRGASGLVPVTVQLGRGSAAVTIESDDEADAPVVVRTVRRWFDLDVDLEAVCGVLRKDSRFGPLLAARPGLRVVGHPAGFEAAVLTVLGQRVSVAAARAFGARLVEAYGTPGPGGFTVFPAPGLLAAVDPAILQADIGVTHLRSRTVQALAAVCADGLELSPEADLLDVRARLLEVPGVGPWTVDYLSVRVLGDRNAFPAGDLVIQRALGVRTAREAAALALGWSPWRAYGLFHLWTAAAYLP